MNAPLLSWAGGLEKILQHFSPDTMQTSETSTPEIIVNDANQKEVINNDSEKSTDISVWKRIGWAYLLSLLLFGIFSLVTSEFTIGKEREYIQYRARDVSFEMELFFSIVLLCIPPLCLMGWLRKQCRWIFAMLICILACLLYGLFLQGIGQVSPSGGTVKSQRVVGQFVKMEVFRCTFFEG